MTAATTPPEPDGDTPGEVLKVATEDVVKVYQRLCAETVGEMLWENAKLTAALAAARAEAADARAQVAALKQVIGR